MARCLISFGANIGHPPDAIRKASEYLERRLVPKGADYQLSRLFRTPPVGGPAGQPPFINAVAAIETQHSAIDVWNTIREVEQALGRQRDRRWEARRIDLDILLYDDHRVWTPQLKIPHPRMCMRRFILIPALDVAADWIDPVSQWSIAQLCQSLQTGPGNLLVIADDVARQTEWLPEIMRQSMAAVVSLGDSPASRESRWISLASVDEFQQAINPPASQQFPLAKLTMVLTPCTADRQAIDAGLDWESRYQSWAESLRIAETSNRLVEDRPDYLSIEGPRYLLSAEDPQWGIHEIVSALEAMDCPVEPM